MSYCFPRGAGLMLALWLAACSPSPTPATQPTEQPAVVLPTVNDTSSPTASMTGLPTASIPPSFAATTLPTARPTSVPTILPSAQPTSKPTNQPTNFVRIFEGTLTLPVYPYARFLTASVDAATGVPFATLDRAAYEASSPTAQARAFKAVVLENDALQMTFLPELGGRLYQVVFKPTNQSIFYRNPVIKPSRWGPFESDKNWWLAAGGMEWAVPVQEHGYEWGVPWSYTTKMDGDAASITLRDSDAPNRLQTQIIVTLRRGETAWTITPQVSNPTARPMRVQFWLNAMLTLGARTIPPDTEFTLPSNAVRVHSTGDKRLPAAKQEVPWPTVQTVDFSRYANWQNWLGVFAMDLNGGTVSARSPQRQLQVTRSFPTDGAPGVKLFAFGPQFPDRSYTDDDSQYFELWGGPNKSFWPEDDVTLLPSAVISWRERWSVSIQ